MGMCCDESCVTCTGPEASKCATCPDTKYLSKANVADAFGNFQV